MDTKKSNRHYEIPLDRYDAYSNAVGGDIAQNYIKERANKELCDHKVEDVYGIGQKFIYNVLTAAQTKVKEYIMNKHDEQCYDHVDA